MTARAEGVSKPLRSEPPFLGLKGSTSTQIILWVGVIIIAGIGLYWFLSHFYNAQYLFELIDNEVLFFSGKINQNCDANYHYFSRNPIIEDGNIFFSKNEVCIRSKSIEKCALLSCGPDKNVSIDLAQIVYIEGIRYGELRIRGVK
ncbi:MAG: hypothetical protein QXK06_04535 [Candidatus Diapherotrites archaeon]